MGCMDKYILLLHCWPPHWSSAWLGLQLGNHGILFLSFQRNIRLRFTHDIDMIKYYLLLLLCDREFGAG